MRKLLFLFFLFPFTLAGQDNTIGKSEPALSRKGNVLLIPNSPTMYRSDCDRELSETNRLPVSRLREAIRRKMAEQLWLSIKTSTSVVLLHPSEPASNSELQYIYASTAHQAKPMEKTEAKKEETPFEKLLSGHTTRSRNEEQTPVTKGQLTVAQQEEKFMETTLTNDRLLPALSQEYGSSYFVFIGEIDILLASGTTQEEIHRGTFKREVRVHYTIMDLQGKVAGSGVASCTFSGKEFNLDRIANTCFSSVAGIISAAIPASPEH